MKKSKLIPIVALLMMVATSMPTYAFDIGLNGNLNIKSEDRDDKNNHDRNKEGEDHSLIKLESNSKALVGQNEMFSNRVKAWVWNSGTTGQVTAVNNGSITIKSSSGEVFTVLTADAMIRKAEDKNASANSSILVGESVYVFGAKNGSSIAASMIIVGKTKDSVKPNEEEKRRAYFGVITAKTDTSLTILSSGNTSYNVSLASDAQIWVNKTKQSSLAGFVVGDNVMVQGSLSGNNISAKNLVAIHLPTGTVVGKITAKNDTSLTILGTDNKTYTVLTSNASIKTKGGFLDVGDSVVVKGDLSNGIISAQSISEEKVKDGFFHRFGIFFKGIFGKKDK